MKKGSARSSANIEGYLPHPEAIGDDLIKKILVLILLLKKAIIEGDVVPLLMDRNWYKETVDPYFNSEQESNYYEIIN